MFPIFFHSELLICHELKPCFRSAAATVAKVIPKKLEVVEISTNHKRLVINEDENIEYEDDEDDDYTADEGDTGSDPGSDPSEDEEEDGTEDGRSKVSSQQDVDKSALPDSS